MANYPVLDFSKQPLYPLQETIHKHPARFKVVALGRQSGKSWLARRAAIEAAANEGKTVWWVAPVYKTARQHWNALISMIEKSNFPIKSKNVSEKEIVFLSGGSISLRSADTPDSLRGATLDLLILDEAAFMPADVWYYVLQATVTASRGSVLFLSTPNGHNWFYDLFKLGLNPDYPEYASWNMPSSASPYQDKRMLEIIRQTVPEYVWRQEYLAEFTADVGSVFTGVEAASIVPFLNRPQPDVFYVAGLDLDSGGDDKTAFTVLEKHSRRQVYGVTFPSSNPKDQIARIKGELDLWQPQTVFIDRTGIGNPIYKMMVLELKNPSDDEVDYMKAEYQYGGTRLIGLSIDNDLKRNMVEMLAALIEFSNLWLLDDKNEYGRVQQSEMSGFIRSRTPNSNLIKYGARKGEHDDTVTALYLAAKGLPKAKLLSNKPWLKKTPKGQLVSPFQ